MTMSPGEAVSTPFDPAARAALEARLDGILSVPDSDSGEPFYADLWITVTYDAALRLGVDLEPCHPEERDGWQGVITRSVSRVSVDIEVSTDSDPVVSQHDDVVLFFSERDWHWQDYLLLPPAQLTAAGAEVYRSLRLDAGLTPDDAYMAASAILLEPESATASMRPDDHPLSRRA
jgi:hypothetical protein